MLKSMELTGRGGGGARGAAAGAAGGALTGGGVAAVAWREVPTTSKRFSVGRAALAGWTEDAAAPFAACKAQPPEAAAS